MEVGLGPGDFVSDGDPAPLPKRGGTPSQIFSQCLLWPYSWIGQDGTWDGGRPQPRRLCVRWGSSPLPKKGVEPPLQFLAHFYCGQTALCIKMPLGVEVDLSPGDFVLDGDPASHQKEGGAPQFLAHGYCDQTADGSRWHLVWRWAFGPGHIVLDGDPAPLCKKGAEPPNFRPMFILTKRLDASR